MACLVQFAGGFRGKTWRLLFCCWHLLLSAVCRWAKWRQPLPSTTRAQQLAPDVSLEAVYREFKYVSWMVSNGKNQDFDMFQGFCFCSCVFVGPEGLEIILDPPPPPNRNYSYFRNPGMIFAKHVDLFSKDVVSCFDIISLICAATSIIRLCFCISFCFHSCLH